MTTLLLFLIVQRLCSSTVDEKRLMPPCKLTQANVQLTHTENLKVHLCFSDCDGQWVDRTEIQRIITTEGSDSQTQRQQEKHESF